MKSWSRLAMGCIVGVSLGLMGAGPAPRYEDVKVQLRREAVLNILKGAMPYRIEAGSSILKETLTFSEPRDLLFAAGRITFAVHCQGVPFPVDQVLHPVFVFRQGSAGTQLVVESLPVGIQGFGRVDVKDFFEPVDLTTLLRQGVNFSGRPAFLELRVEKVSVSKDSIDISAHLQISPPAAR
ncbi:MAG TPA: hypothetical protein VGR38_06225 [Candidatus Polarisedimenticolia bacterium]|nr:hypothetical protein [Candidatus Polarisedimenticolia bacterium]